MAELRRRPVCRARGERGRHRSARRRDAAQRLARTGSGDPGVDLLKPAWDHSKTLWALDRGAQGAVVWAMPGRRAAQVQVPGITGERVRDFIVSRDGSRMVAVVAGARGDRVVAARIARNRGRIRALAPTVIWQEPGSGWTCGRSPGGTRPRCWWCASSAPR
ncbi:LpqB family beta-propeller domain-containing protein [Nocardioides alcanivorans]|uniref:LpqB family beta-propeller domain-containing protein n=1 Tax=Nocardioides alcanivorans TaxID=2897352 RepID=UPI0035D60AE2